MRLACLLALTLVIICTAGCVRRTITIDSSPSGALVWLNDREVGRTPVEVDFLYYGDYDVRLEHDDADPILASGVTNPPLWDMVPFDLVAELLPFELHSRVHWHYDLEPRQDDLGALRSRAGTLRKRVLGIEKDNDETTSEPEIAESAENAAGDTADPAK